MKGEVDATHLLDPSVRARCPSIRASLPAPAHPEGQWTDCFVCHRPIVLMGNSVEKFCSYVVQPDGNLSPAHPLCANEITGSGHATKAMSLKAPCILCGVQYNYHHYDTINGTRCADGRRALTQAMQDRMDAGTFYPRGVTPPTTLDHAEAA